MRSSKDRYQQEAAKPDGREIRDLKTLTIETRQSIWKRIKPFQIGTAVCSYSEDVEDHLGVIREFGFVFRDGQRRLVALTSLGGWCWLHDLVQCPTPEEQRRLQEAIRARQGLCSLDQWEQLKKEGCYV